MYLAQVVHNWRPYGPPWLPTRLGNAIKSIWFGEKRQNFCHSTREHNWACNDSRLRTMKSVLRGLLWWAKEDSASGSVKNYLWHYHVVVGARHINGRAHLSDFQPRLARDALKRSDHSRDLPVTQIVTRTISCWPSSYGPPLLRMARMSSR